MVIIRLAAQWESVIRRRTATWVRPIWAALFTIPSTGRWWTDCPAPTRRLPVVRVIQNNRDLDARAVDVLSDVNLNRVFLYYYLFFQKQKNEKMPQIAAILNWVWTDADLPSAEPRPTHPLRPVTAEVPAARASDREGSAYLRPFEMDSILTNDRMIFFRNRLLLFCCCPASFNPY